MDTSHKKRNIEAPFPSQKQGLLRDIGKLYYEANEVQLMVGEEDESIISSYFQNQFSNDQKKDAEYFILKTKYTSRCITITTKLSCSRVM
ncbi:18144_t:CDS:2 [Funneliformis geosporum]|uniref:14932_t:CDS:1 n=1 Tax=Funneliformis geosporum TaxID=1117311 RepID=A0A9W4T1C9_9GLOM|nr:14932_t:CDS:2 [Funneliformis geosporum]CAI2188875.1 18144_t:CDS:2 [Funneliformis geosporum]